MKTRTPGASPYAAFWAGIQLEGDLSPAQARALLKLHFSPHDVERMRELSAKARAGSLSPQEAAAMDAYEQFGCLLDVLHSKARRVLKKRPAAS